MFTKRIDLFRLFGFPVRLDVSWFIVAALVAWSLATGLFPARIPGLPTATYWAMGIVGTIALFGSVVLHEFSHALVARRQGIPMRGITLFIFGGVAEMGAEPASARGEFLSAVAGPLASILIAALCFVVASAVHGIWPLPVAGVIAYLAFINALLATFNLLPAFPLDGGRILRAALWKWKNDFRWATSVAARVGSGFSLAFMLLGVLTLLRGDFIDGLWWFLIGLFLRRASTASYEQVLLRRAFEGEPVRRSCPRSASKPASTWSSSLITSSSLMKLGGIAAGWVGGKPSSESPQCGFAVAGSAKFSPHAWPLEAVIPYSAELRERYAGGVCGRAGYIPPHHSSFQSARRTPSLQGLSHGTLTDAV